MDTKIKPLPPKLQEAFDSVKRHPGEDIFFVFGEVSESAAWSYVSRLKKKGLVYTYRSGRTTEVWPVRGK